MVEKEELIERMLTKGFKKLTGPPEDWLKALVDMEWGFRDKDRLRKEWDNICEGDVFVFHSMKTEHLGDYDTPTGIIGVGVVSGKFTGEDKDIGFEPPNLRPLRIKFGEMWWFGDVGKINAKEKFHDKVKKGKLYIKREIDFLLLNCVTFPEMKARGFTISTQGAIQNVRQDKWRPLVELISPRLKHRMSSS